MFDWALALTLAAQPGAPPPPSDPPSARTEAVMTVVFADMVRAVPGLSGAPYDGAVFCVEAPGRSDPSAAVLAAVAQLDPDARPQSACQTITDSTGFVRATEQATGNRAIYLNVSAITCARPDTCLVECGYFSQSLSASGNRFTVERRNGEWIVANRQMLWIS